MLETKQHSVLGNFLDFQIHNPVPDLLKKWVGELILLVSPQDTTDDTDKEIKISENQTGNTRGIIKVLFLVAISIAVSVALGQLN